MKKEKNWIAGNKMKLKGKEYSVGVHKFKLT